MSSLYIYTLFEKDGKPCCTGIKIGREATVFDLFRKGSKRLVAEIYRDRALIRDLIVGASWRGHKIVTSDFKSHLVGYKLPLDTRQYNVYDLHLPELKSTGSQVKDWQVVRQVLDKMAQQTTREYQKLIANAGVVYQDLENRGLLVNFCHMHPLWSQKTFSGRSKTSGFNIQGYTEPFQILPTTSHERDVVIHFDWICADIKVAGILADDRKLLRTFQASDPYEAMALELKPHGQVTRNECKIALLKAINSMDLLSTALTEVYPALGRWIERCRVTMQRGDGYLETLLGRRFRITQAKNQLAVLNGIMQGSVAHGMQNVIRKVWERLGSRLIAEIHDSLVVTSPPDQHEIRATIKTTGEVMLHPFAGLLPTNPAFPFKVSIGRRWREWKYLETHRGQNHGKQPQGSAESHAANASC